MENMRPGVAERLGVGYERLSAINPRLVYSSVTAFGSTGPDADRPGFDPIFQALGGLMTLQGFGGPPVYLRTAPTDYYTAALATQGILSALFARERTGRGQRVETSLLRGALALQAGVAIDYPDQADADPRQPDLPALPGGRRRLVLPRGRQPDVLGEALQGARARAPGRRPALRPRGSRGSRTTRRSCR